MKKVLISALVLFAFGVASAQQVKFGVKAGLNLSTFSGDAVGDDVSMKAGLHAGGLVEIKFTDKLALQPEVLFSMQGAKVVSEGFDGAVSFHDEFKRNLSYINVPVMLKFYPAGGFYLEGGPQVGFLVAAKAKVESTDTEDGVITRISRTDDVKDQYKSVDFAFNFGLGYDFTQNFYAGARYSFGLSGIQDSPFTIYDVDRKNNVLSLSVGYKF
jgi:opacity protein-like surface antigen